MRFHLTTVAAAVLALGAGLGASRVAQAQVIPEVPLRPATAASGPMPAPQAVPGAPVAAQPQGGAAAPTETAPTTFISPSVAVLVTQSSNANFGTGLAPQSDTIVNIVPRLQFESDHVRWRAFGDFRVNGQYYARGTQTNSALPGGTLGLRSQLVDQLLYFDADLTSQQNLINPYVGQQAAPGSNQYTSTQLRIRPYIDKALTPDLRLLLRSDDTWTWFSNLPDNYAQANGRYTVQTAELTQRPLPYGYALRAEQAEAVYNDLPYATWKDTSFRAIGNYALTPQTTVGIIGGYEQVEAFLAKENNPIYGARFDWAPNPQSRFQGTVEHRFFGTGWNLQGTGGSQLLQFSVSWTRQPTTFLQSLVQGGVPGANLTTLLDGMLQSQYADPIARARAVQAILAETGLPAGLASTQLFGSSLSLQNSLTGLVVLLQERNSYALSVFRSKSEDLFLPGQQVLQQLQTLSSDNLQTGAAFNFGRRLDPITNLNITLVRTLTSGFGINEGQSARQTGLFVQIDRRLTPSTIGLIGVRRQLLRSTVAGNSNESAVFAGLVHRF